MSRNHYAQIDIMKGLAIVGVVVIHSTISAYLLQHGGQFWLAQSVPVFMVLLGMNLGMSLSRSGSTELAEVYGNGYWTRRWNRLFVPFAIAFCVSGLIAVVGVLTQPGFHLNVGWLTFVGVVPAGGPGNYFFTVLLQFVVIGPALWVAYRRWSGATLAGALLADVGFEYWASRSALVAGHPYIQEAWIPRYVLAIVLGMWLADGWSFASRRNTVVIIGATLGLTYLAYNAATGWTAPRVVYDVPTTYSAAYFYAAGLVMIGMSALPRTENGTGWHILARIGRESYHVFLVQMLWFSSLAVPASRLVSSALPGPPQAPLEMILVCAINVAACLVGGSLFFRLLAPRRARAVSGSGADQLDD